MKNPIFIPALICFTCVLVLGCALVHSVNVNKRNALIKQGAVGNGIQTNFVVAQ